MSTNLNSIHFHEIFDRFMEFLHINLDQVMERLTEHCEQRYSNLPSIAVYMPQAVYHRIVKLEMTADDLKLILTAFKTKLSYDFEIPQETYQSYQKKNYPDIWSESIDVLEMPIRPTNCLKHAEPPIEYVGQLIAMDISQLHRVPGLGSKMVKYVLEAVKAKSLDFNTNTTGWQAPSN